MCQNSFSIKSLFISDDTQGDHLTQMPEEAVQAAEAADETPAATETTAAEPAAETVAEPETAAATQPAEAAAEEAVDPEDVSYQAVEKEGNVTAIWEMQGQKHLRTIDPRSHEGKQILALFETAG
jgi:hypothetical protein